MESISEKLDQQEELNIRVIKDPGVVQAAQYLYRLYTQAYPNPEKTPIGVAINPENYRGEVCSRRPRPILLPGECFVPFNQL